jgi:hypothetical protein
MLNGLLYEPGKMIYIARPASTDETSILGNSQRKRVKRR